MITERLNKLNEIIDGHSVRLRDSYFSKNYTDIYNQIIIYCQDINELNFKQKIWHWANNKPGYYLCKCGAKTTFHKNWLDGYRRFCSPKCSQSERDTKEKRKKTTIAKYGVDNIAKADTTKKKQEKTNIEKWGTKSSAQNQSVKEKIKNNKKKQMVFTAIQMKEKALGEGNKEVMYDMNQMTLFSKPAWTNGWTRFPAKGF